MPISKWPQSIEKIYPNQVTKIKQSYTISTTSDWNTLLSATNGVLSYARVKLTTTASTTTLKVRVVVDGVEKIYQIQSNNNGMEFSLYAVGTNSFANATTLYTPDGVSYALADAKQYPNNETVGTGLYVVAIPIEFKTLSIELWSTSSTTTTKEFSYMIATM